MTDAGPPWATVMQLNGMSGHAWRRSAIVELRLVSGWFGEPEFIGARYERQNLAEEIPNGFLSPGEVTMGLGEMCVGSPRLRSRCGPILLGVVHRDRSTSPTAHADCS